MLLQTVQADLGTILEDSAQGFGQSMTVTNPAGTSATVTGFFNDIAQTIDLDTGQVVSGRTVSATIRIELLTSVGLAVPYGVSDSSLKPWTVGFTGVDGQTQTFRVVQASPDRVFGAVILALEAYTS